MSLKCHNVLPCVFLASKRNLCFFGKEQLLDATHEATQDEAAELREAAVWIIVGGILFGVGHRLRNGSWAPGGFFGHMVNWDLEMKFRLWGLSAQIAFWSTIKSQMRQMKRWKYRSSRSILNALVEECCYSLLPPWSISEAFASWASKGRGESDSAVTSWSC